MTALPRRTLLKSATAAATVAALPAAFAPASAQTPAPPGMAGSAEDAKANALWDRLMTEGLDRSPEGVTSLGLDSGPRAAQKAKLDDRSPAALAGDQQRNAADLAALNAIDRSKLTGINPSNLDSLVFGAAVNDAIYKTGYDQIGSPYVVSQLTGAYQSIPDFLDSQHSIATTADAEAYLSRLAAFATALDQESEILRRDTARGVTPPDFVIERTVGQLKSLRDAPPATANLVQSLARRAQEKHLPGDWEARATAIYTAQVQPALDRQLALVAGLAPAAVHTAGVHRLPKGDEYYALSLKNYTTSTMSPAEIHQTGLDLIARQTADIDTILKAQGFTQGTVGARLNALFTDPKFIYPNTDAGKDQLIADLQTLVDKVQMRLPEYFGALPKAKLTIKRVPKFTEAGAPGGYYQNGALDGSRPGAYYINLRDTAEVPKWVLPTLTYHEGIPGHHLQLSIAQEAPLPLIRKVQFFSGYGEGWALYAEQLAAEMGMYADDPLGHVGQLKDAMFRSVRMVVDSGMHAMGWTREQAIDFGVKTLGDKESVVATEIERYCVWPGQACSYMIGKLTWLRLREKAKTALGPKFDIRKFHDAGLLAGAMPLVALENRIDGYIAAG